MKPNPDSLPHLPEMRRILISSTEVPRLNYCIKTLRESATLLPICHYFYREANLSTSQLTATKIMTNEKFKKKFHSETLLCRQTQSS